MKYGEKLAEWSEPKWAHYNLDYNEVKKLIKDRTSAGRGKAVSIPGQGNESEKQFEDELYQILVEQHDRISMFVKLRLGETERRLRHVSDRVQRLEAFPPKEDRTYNKRLNLYLRLNAEMENIKQVLSGLPRFINANKVAFRKLLKKYRKWTGSDRLSYMFTQYLQGRPGSFTNIDLGQLLDSYSDTLAMLRAKGPYNDSSSSKGQAGAPAQADAVAQADVGGAVDLSNDLTIIAKLQEAVDSGSEVELDSALAVLPLGGVGSKSTYWVHSDNLVELQVLLMQYTRRYLPRSPRASRTATPARRDSADGNAYTTGEQDSNLVVLDNLDRFGTEQSGSPLSNIETAGAIPERAVGSARWNPSGDAFIALGTSKRRGADSVQARLKAKHLFAVLNSDSPRMKRSGSTVGIEPSAFNTTENIEKVESWLKAHNDVKPLASVHCKRTRFIGLQNGATRGIWVNIDRDIVMKTYNDRDLTDPVGQSQFPYYVLEVRQEGGHASELLKALDNSHLTERVRGFSLETHAVWCCCKPSSMQPPFWLPLLDKDIKKIPATPTKPRRRSSALGDMVSKSDSTSTLVSTSATSVTDGQTSATTPSGIYSDVPVPTQLETAPLTIFKKKRRRQPKKRLSQTQEEPLLQQPQERYWNEYDNPEDGDENAFYIFIDPDKPGTFPGKEALSALTSRIRTLFTGSGPSVDAEQNPISATDSASSSDEEDTASPCNYGTLTSSPGTAAVVIPARSTLTVNKILSQLDARQRARDSAKLRIYTICFIASLALLGVAYILAATGRRKQRSEVDGGIIFGVSASLLLAFVGAGTALSREGKGGKRMLAERLLLGAVFVGICVAAGGLIAWVVT